MGKSSFECRRGFGWRLLGGYVTGKESGVDEGQLLLYTIDLLFVCDGGNGHQSLQMWINEREDEYRLAHEYSLPAGAGALSFADIGKCQPEDMQLGFCIHLGLMIDGDGSIDIIFPVKHGSQQQIHIVYNQQMDLCAKADEKNNQSCRKAGELCVADPNFKFDFTSPNSRVSA